MALVAVKQKTSLKTATVIGLFVVGAFSVGMFAGLGVYISQQEFGILTAEECARLSENQCQQNSTSCQALFDQGAQFVGCKGLSPTQRAQRTNDQAICSQSGGRYTANRFGPYCDCSITGKKFVAGIGCG